METQKKLPAQSKPKSILDLTPYEIAMIDQYQTRNRGFEYDGEEDLENVFSWED